jgi:hypothetical protein
LRCAAAVREHDARAGLEQRPDRAVGVLGRVQVVRPVQERRDAGVERLERSDEVPGVGVLGPVVAGEAGVNAREVVRERPIRRDVAPRRLPRVAMAVHEAGHHDVIGRLDDVAVPRLDRGRDGGDAPVLDQDVTDWQIADLPIQRQDRAAPDQHTMCGQPSSSNAVRAGRKRILHARALSRVTKRHFVSRKSPLHGCVPRV